MEIDFYCNSCRFTRPPLPLDGNTAFPGLDYPTVGIIDFSWNFTPPTTQRTLAESLLKYLAGT